MINALGAAAVHAGRGFGGPGGLDGSGCAIGGPFYGGYGFAGHPSSGPFGAHLMALVTFAAIGIAIWFFATGRHRGPSAVGSTAAIPAATPFGASTHPADIDPAEEVARARYARGEIDAEEYATIIKTLRGGA